MTTSINAALGVTFLALAVLATALMYQFWGYPYDKEARKSACPQWKMNIHRGVGFAYALVYVVLMVQMVPRMWQYQVEFPARTVAHMMLGITIGVLLLIKISILRFWRHFEEWMPFLGTALLLCTFLLTGLSLPFVYKVKRLEARAPGGGAFSAESRARVARLLGNVDMGPDANPGALATETALRRGRSVLLRKCVQCHDLKTIISKPRTPADWYRTVVRMADKPTLGEPIDARDQREVTAFLVAITPDLQRSAKRKREDALARRAAEHAAKRVTATPAQSAAATAAVDPADAKATFERVCSQCHEWTDIAEEEPESVEDVDDLIERMVGNGLEAPAEDLAKVRWHLMHTYVRDAAPAQP
ncbi:MAG: hypothetical protein D6689_22415 [Deltaproteobacteria bacterium]|nr:MAG: hypothetical protein D6689_22415 [Deltaproteobacteria bacterium]